MDLLVVIVLFGPEEVHQSREVVSLHQLLDPLLVLGQGLHTTALLDKFFDARLRHFVAGGRSWQPGSWQQATAHTKRPRADPALGS